MRFQLQSATGTGEIIKEEEGLVSEKFNIPERCLPEDIDNSCYPHLKDIDIPEVQVKAVSVLIGKDVDYAHEVFEVRKPSSPDNRLKTLQGPLGWVVTGVVAGHPSSKEISVNFTNCKKKLCELVKVFWKLEAFGRQGAPESREDEQVNRVLTPHNWSMEGMCAVETLQSTTRLSHGCYETGLLWRNEDVWLPNNHCEAKRRKCSLKRRVSRDLDLEQRYRAVMKEYIGKGYARELSPEEADHLSKKGGRRHNCWPITIGDTGLKSTYQLCRRDPSGNRKKGTFTCETLFWWLMITLQGTSGPWDESKTCFPERMD